MESLPTLDHCGYKFIPAAEGIFKVDNDLNIACYCPKCEQMVTIDYSINENYWLGGK